VGTTPGGDDVLCAMADPVTGYRRVPEFGGMQRLQLTIEQLMGPPYYWSVQSIDAGLAGSIWASGEAVAFSRVFNSTRGTRHDTIQEAINAAQAGDHIVLAPGVYTGDGNRDLHFLYGGSGSPINIKLSSIDPLNAGVVASTIIDCQGSAASPHRAMRFADQSSTMEVAGLTFRNGYAPVEGTAPAGGAIVVVSAAPTIHHCVFTNCHSDGQGGAIAVVGFLWAEAVIHHCTFSGNSANAGGAVSSIGALCRISYCRLAGNSAVSGGAVYVTGISWPLTPYLLSCLLDSNHASGQGGALFCQDASSIELTNFTMANNTAAVGGGIYAGGININVYNSILWSNHDNSGSGPDAQLSAASSSPFVYYSCIQGWTNTSHGTIAADPLFVDPDGPDDNPLTWADNNLRLDRRSPCVNAAHPYPGYTGEWDLDGRARMLNCRVDMGAYESSWSLSWADYNGDCHVDASDWLHFEACSSGPMVPQTDPDCLDADLDSDGDVDCEDMAIFQRCWTGPTIFVTADCE
jgi:predicted outer membrane repeat protein